MKSTGIVSSNEGHDESHIDDMKLGTNFLNNIDNVTIGLTQSTDTKTILTAKINFFLPLNIGWHDKRLGNMTRPDRHTLRQWTMRSFVILQRSDMTHESGLTCKSAEYPID